MRVSKIKPIVRQVLIEEPQTRKDDFKLINLVIKKLTYNDSLEELSMFHTSWNIPSFESITRCRRAIQKEQPELKDKKTALIRAEEEKLYHEEFKRK